MISLSKMTIVYKIFDERVLHIVLLVVTIISSKVQIYVVESFWFFQNKYFYCLSNFTTMEREEWKIVVYGKQGVGTSSFVVQHVQRMFLGKQRDLTLK